ncbi:MAG: NAD-dependent epimerase/dehydratase family protein [Desulfosarcina sp.]|nr:NAD-dependent epimerase/dehydratase family protein [Desulfobacterales bacterium]
MKKNILVIGGSYFYGRVFTETFYRDRGYHIYIINRGNNPLDIEGVEEIICDRTDMSALKKYLPKIKWDAVIDFCAYTPQDARCLLSALNYKSIKHYILISTVSIYRQTRDLPIKENSPKLTGPQPELGMAAGYGYNKMLTEKFVSTHCRQYHIPYTFLRPAVIFGKYNYAPRESYFFDLITNGKPVVLPELDLPLFQFVSVWDAVQILIQCIGNTDTFNHAYNLAGPELISYGRLIEVFELVTGLNIQTRHMSMASIDSRRIPLPFPLDSHLIYSGLLIQQTLDYRYTPFSEGMRRTWEWYRQS